MLSAFRDAKLHSIGFLDAVKRAALALRASDSLASVELLISFGLMVPIVIFAEAMAARYCIRRQAILSSISVSLAVAAVPVLSLAVLYEFSLYAFVR